MVAPQVGCIRPFGTSGCHVNHINAGAHLLPEAAATQERRLGAVRCSALILIEAPSPADHRGMLIRGNTC